MEEEEQRHKLKEEIIENIGSKRYYELVCSCDIKWNEGLSFTQEMLKIAFAPYGAITDLALEAKRNRAVLTLSSIENCNRLVQEFKHPLISVNFHVGAEKREKLLKALKVDKNAKIDLTLNSENIQRIKEIINRKSGLYLEPHPRGEEREYINIS